jgi:putative ABC transport system permease protein
VLSIGLALPLTSLGLVLSRGAIPASVVRFVPGWQYLSITPAVFWSTAALGAVATVIFALLPALHTSRADVADTLRQGSRSTTAPRQRHWLRNSLAAAQVAVTLALLFGSWLMVSGTERAVKGTFGFDKNNLLVARIVLPDRPYAEVERRRQFVDGVLDRVRAIPAVSNASMVSALPYSGSNTSRDFYPEGVVDRREVQPVHYRRISSQYIETMKIPLLAGRTLTDADREGTQQVALVSRKLVERYWPKGDALGRTFKVAADGPPITVVGIVGDVLHDWFQETRFPTVYRPAGQDAPQTAIFVMRTVGEPTSVAGDVRRAVAAIDPDQPIMLLATMDKVVEDHTAGVTFIARALGIMAVIALVLAVMGLYSLMAFTISRRTQELGVRMALGATRWQVIGLTTRQGMKITIAGLLVGALAAGGLGRLMESMLFGLVHASVWQLAGMTLLVAAIAMIASYVPARRTASLDPTVALRTE